MRSAKPGYYDRRRPPLSGAARELAEAASLAKEASDRAGAGAISAYNESWREAAGSLVGAHERLTLALAAVELAIALLEDEIKAAAGERPLPAYAAEALQRLEEAG